MMNKKRKLANYGAHLLTRFLQLFPPGYRRLFLNIVWESVDKTLDPENQWQTRQHIFSRYFSAWPLLNAETQSRIYGFFELVCQIAHVPGDIVECGVGRGNSLTTLVMATATFHLSRTVYGFDSFVGFPPASSQDLGERVRHLGVPEGWANTSVTLIEKAIEKNLENIPLNTLPPVHLVPGFFHETMPFHLPERIALLHVDCDLYESTHVVLEACLPLMSAEGIVIFDEYHDVRWPGVKKAVDELCDLYGLKIEYFPFVRRYGFYIPNLKNW